MRKFTALLKKELKELMTLQMLVPLLIGVAFFIFIGNVMGSESKKVKDHQDIALLDLDNSTASGEITDILSRSGFSVKFYTQKDITSVIEEAKSKRISAVISIPAGFEKGLNEFKPQKVETYSIIRNFSLTGTGGAKVLTAAVETINQYASNRLISAKAPGSNPMELKNPVIPQDHVIVGEKTASATMDQVMGFITSQTAFIPIIMFIIIIFAAQMIAVTVASEKENKTLETLLSTPISRTSLVSAKMVAAGIVSLLSAGIYMFGFRYYMEGFTGDALKATSEGQMGEVIKQLGLTLNTGAYILLGASLFLSILIALAISLILGAFAEDVKKVQGLVAPITFLIMIPYFVSMFIDLNTASPALKYFIYAIPFSHTFLASPNLFAHNYAGILYGIAYQAIVFLVFVFIAAKIFSTDKILTMKLSFGKKKGQ